VAQTGNSNLWSFFDGFSMNHWFGYKNYEIDGAAEFELEIEVKNNGGVDRVAKKHRFWPSFRERTE
jgi:hypothetical protein